MTTEVTELKAVQVKNTVDKVKLTWSVFFLDRKFKYYIFFCK